MNKPLKSENFHSILIANKNILSKEQNPIFGHKLKSKIMKFLKFGLIALITFLSIATTQAQTADDIINKHIDAVGGKDLLSKINTMYVEGTVTAMGTDYVTKVNMVNGKALKSETDVNGSTIIQCITDTGGWSLNPLMGQSDPTMLTPDEVKMAKSSLDLRGQLYNYKDKGLTATLVGRDSIQGVSDYKIKLVDNNNGSEFTYYIDPTTYYISKLDVKATVSGKDVTNSSSFSNYKKTDFGYVVANTMATTNMGYDIVINYNKVEINKDIDPKIFAMPK